MELSEQIILTTLLVAVVVHIYQFISFRKNKENGSSHARVQVLVKLILSLLIWKTYEWAPHFTALFALFDANNSFSELIAAKTLRSSHTLVVLLDTIVVISTAALFFE